MSLRPITGIGVDSVGVVGVSSIVDVAASGSGSGSELSEDGVKLLAAAGSLEESGVVGPELVLVLVQLAATKIVTKS